MNSEQKQAYDWAINQQYQSVAARYARTLAQFIHQHSIQETCDGCNDIRGPLASEHKCHTWNTFNKQVSEVYLHHGSLVYGKCQCIECNPE